MVTKRPNRQRSSGKKKYFIIAAVVLLVCVGGYFGWKTFTGADETQKQAEANQKAEEERNEKYPDRIRLIASGDMVAHDSVNLNAKQGDGTYDYTGELSEMSDIFAAADIRFCNQVTPAGGKELGVIGYPLFNAPAELVRDLGKTGCNLVNMASNHSFDKSQDAINNNVAAWEDLPDVLAAAGQNRNTAERDKVHTFTVKGVKFAFLAYTTYINSGAPAQNDFGVTKYSRALAKDQVAKAETAGADIVIVSMRWGTEYSPITDGGQQGESEYLADLGVDVVLGHGPHVLQPVKELSGKDGNKTLVWYSLGNFLNTQLETEALFNGLAVMDFDKNTKQITNIGYLPIYSSYAWTAEQAKAEDLLARTDVKLYALDDVTQDIINRNRLETTAEAQRTRISDTLNTHMTIPLLTKAEYLD